MNLRATSAVAFKLFGIYVVVSTIIAMPMVLGTFLSTRRQFDGLDASPLWPVVIAIVTIIVAVIAFKLLWKLGNGALSSSAEVDGDESDQSGPAVERTLFMLLGVYFAVAALLDAPTAAATLWARSHTPAGVSVVDYAWLLSLIGQFLVGLSLIARLDRWLAFLRQLGTR